MLVDCKLLCFLLVVGWLLLLDGQFLWCHMQLVYLYDRDPLFEFALTPLLWGERILKSERIIYVGIRPITTDFIEDTPPGVLRPCLGFVDQRTNTSGKRSTCTRLTDNGKPEYDWDVGPWYRKVVWRATDHFEEQKKVHSEHERQSTNHYCDKLVTSYIVCTCIHCDPFLCHKKAWYVHSIGSCEGLLWIKTMMNHDRLQWLCWSIPMRRVEFWTLFCWSHRVVEKRARAAPGDLLFHHQGLRAGQAGGEVFSNSGGDGRARLLNWRKMPGAKGAR